MSVPSTTTSATPGTSNPKSGHKTIADFGLQRRRVDSFKQPEQFLEWIGDCEWKSYEVVDPKATQDDRVIFRYSVALEKNSFTTHFIENTTHIQKSSTHRTEMLARDMVADAYRAEGGDLETLKYLGTSSIINGPAQDMIKEEFEAQGKHISRPGHAELDPRSGSWKNISKTPLAKSNVSAGNQAPEPPEKVSAADLSSPALDCLGWGGGLDDQSVLRLGLDADSGTLPSTTTPHAPILPESKPAKEPASPRSSEQTDFQDNTSLQDGNSETSGDSNCLARAHRTNHLHSRMTSPPRAHLIWVQCLHSRLTKPAQLDDQATMSSSDHSDQPDQSSSEDSFGQSDDQASTGSSDSEAMSTVPDDLTSTSSSDLGTRTAVWQVQLADLSERRRRLQVDMNILIRDSERGHMYTEE
ncbi:hypothetical protein SCAR479_02850 [Seiridium cardinale]|uniref:Uncharacterized protein n=1 Tax=Seiridium cardinale TaxID=138064 RepID=A0ABR2Y2A5_9PEZI